METGTISSDSVSSLVARCKMQLRLTTSDDDLYLQLLCNEGIRHIDSLSILVKKQCRLVVNNNSAQLPSDFSKLIGIRVGNNQTSGTVSNPVFGQLIYVDLPFLRSSGVNDNNPNFRSINGSYQIQGNYIIISNVVAGIAFNGEPIPLTSIDLAYFGFNKNENGLMQSYDDYERGVSAYACWMYCLQNADQYNQYQIEKYEEIWIAQKKWIKSKDVQDQFNNNKREMASVLNAWVVSKTWDT